MERSIFFFLNSSNIFKILFDSERVDNKLR